MGHSTDINENEHLQYIFNDYKSGIEHGILVANITYELAKRLKLDERECYELKIAGMMHDIGKLKLSEYLYGRNSGELSVEEMKYMRMHSKISFDVLKNYDYSDNIMKVVLYHHECYDGSGYPDNLKGTDIPLGARILKVTDEFAALISDRPYRKAFDIDTAVNILIEEIKNLDMRVEAEHGATEGKFDLAKRAKAANLDAIHDTVHEMARDEARHGKAFEGLLKRYFG